MFAVVVETAHPLQITEWLVLEPCRSSSSSSDHSDRHPDKDHHLSCSMGPASLVDACPAPDNLNRQLFTEMDDKFPGHRNVEI